MTPAAFVTAWVLVTTSVYGGVQYSPPTTEQACKDAREFVRSSWGSVGRSAECFAMPVVPSTQR